MNERVVAGTPRGPARTPRDVAVLTAPDDTATPVWRNELGGLTFRLHGPTRGTRYGKWTAHGTPEIDLADEARRLDWARRWASVPAVVDHGTGLDGTWLMTAPLPGRSAVDPRWLDEPERAATAIGEGLRHLHDAAPVAECPWRWSVEDRLRCVAARLAYGEGPADWSVEHRDLTVAEVRARLTDPPPIDRLVVCHGDACAPNSLLRDDGRFSGHVDLGSLGVADRWADLAVAAWSLDWNYGPGYEHLMYSAYGVDPDPDRIAYYRLLWGLG